MTDEQIASGRFWDKGPQVTTGCTKISPGCKICWAERNHRLRSGNKAMHHIYRPDSLTDGCFNGKVYFNLNKLQDAVKGKKPQVIAPWNDLYHEGVTDRQIWDAHNIMTSFPHHTFLIITKRPQIAVDYFTRIEDCLGMVVELPSNIIHIATMENQAMADKRMGDLLRIPGRRAILIEPMLGPIENIVLGRSNRDIQQIILGPENGAGKRHFDPAWAESVKAQCESAGVPFYRKDKGEGELIWR